MYTYYVFPRYLYGGKNKSKVAWYNKGIALFNLKRHEEALKAFDKCIEINPKLAGAWNNKGTALSKLGRYEDILLAYGKANEIDPKIAAVWYNKGVALINLGRYGEAKNSLKEHLNQIQH